MLAPAKEDLTDQLLIELILGPKPVPHGSWRSQLRPRGLASDPANLRGHYELTDVRGYEWLLYTRASLRNSKDWSTGLIFDPNGARLRFVRCNGPHIGVHQNRLDPTEPPIVVTPHVHYVREKYLRHPRTKEDGYAVPCSAYSDLDGAIEHLAIVSNLIPEGRLIL